MNVVNVIPKHILHDLNRFASVEGQWEMRAVMEARINRIGLVVFRRFTAE